MELGLLFCFYIYMDDLAHNDMALILGADMNIGVSIKTCVTYDKPFILTEK
jgi:hypothetical protein